MTVSPVAEPVGSLDRSGSTPLYIQLANVLREKIERGEWKPDQKIPSENELRDRFAVARTTVRNAMALLVREGLGWRLSPTELQFAGGRAPARRLGD